VRLGRSSSQGRHSQVAFPREYSDIFLLNVIADWPSSTNLTVGRSASRVSPDQLPPLPPHENLAPAPIDQSVDKWFFISGAAN